MAEVDAGRNGPEQGLQVHVEDAPVDVDSCSSTSVYDDAVTTSDDDEREDDGLSDLLPWNSRGLALAVLDGRTHAAAAEVGELLGRITGMSTFFYETLTAEKLLPSRPLDFTDLRNWFMWYGHALLRDYAGYRRHAAWTAFVGRLMAVANSLHRWIAHPKCQIMFEREFAPRAFVHSEWLVVRYGGVHGDEYDDAESWLYLRASNGRDEVPARVLWNHDRGEVEWEILGVTAPLFDLNEDMRTCMRTAVTGIAKTKALAAKKRFGRRVLAVYILHLLLWRFLWMYVRPWLLQHEQYT